MQRVTAAVVSTTVAVGLALAAPAAGSVFVGAQKPKFCRTLEKLSENVVITPPTESGQVDPEQAATSAKGLRKAAKTAPKSLRKALKTLAAFNERIAAGDALDDIITEQGAELSEASTRYGLYYAGKCLGLQVPSTLPPT